MTSAHGIVAVISDGCGSSPYSEMGARIGVNLMTTHLQRQLARGCNPDAQLLRRVRQSVLSQLDVLTQNMGESLSKVVNDFMLFTLLGAVITPETALFFALGDGVIIINGEAIVLDSGPRNMPIYLGYAMTGSSLTDDDPSRLDFSIVRRLPTSDLQHFLIGTDGVGDAIKNEARFLPGTKEVFGPLSQFWEKDDYFKPDTVATTLQLNLMARDVTYPTPKKRIGTHAGLLPDDTTLIAGRRRQTELREE